MNALVRRIRQWIFLFWHPDWRLPAAKRKREQSRAKVISETGRFYFKEEILDQLADYFICIRKLRHEHPAGYDIYSKIGAAIVSRKSMVEVYKLPPSWRAGMRPSFGATTMVGEAFESEDKTTVPGKFQYFIKARRPPWYVERTNHDVYEVVMFHTLTHEEMAAATNFHVAVAPDGTMRLLKWLRTSWQEVRSKRRHEVFSIPQRGWQWPPRLAWLYRDVSQRIEERHGRQMVAIDEYAVELFSYIVNLAESAASDISVRASNGTDTAVFSVDLLRTPYFFRDREVYVTESGHRKPIFHVVRPHRRRLASGETVIVKNHFRGHRTFVWNGYDVRITLAGRHHNDPSRFEAGFEEFEGEAVPKGFVDAEHVGKMMQKGLSR